jgi:hypothetical protein
VSVYACVCMCCACYVFVRGAGQYSRGCFGGAIGMADTRDTAAARPHGCSGRFVCALRGALPPCTQSSSHTLCSHLLMLSASSPMLPCLLLQVLGCLRCLGIMATDLDNEQAPQLLQAWTGGSLMLRAALFLP